MCGFPKVFCWDLHNSIHMGVQWGGKVCSLYKVIWVGAKCEEFQNTLSRLSWLSNKILRWTLDSQIHFWNQGCWPGHYESGRRPVSKSMEVWDQFISSVQKSRSNIEDYQETTREKIWGHHYSPYKSTPSSILNSSLSISTKMQYNWKQV